MKNLILFCCCLALVHQGQAQTWTAAPLDSTNEDVLTGSMALHKGKLYLTTYPLGLMVSNNKGKSFSEVKGDTIGNVRFLESAGNRLYGVTWYYRDVVYTADEGKTWQADTINLPRWKDDFNRLQDLSSFFCYANGTKLWADFGTYGQYQKDVNDKEWTKITSLENYSPVQFTHAGDTLFMVDSSIVYMSTNDGQNWKALRHHNLPPKFYPTFLYKFQERLYLMAITDKQSKQNFGIYYSDNLGKTGTPFILNTS